MKKYTDEEILAAVKEHGSNNKAAKALGVNRRAVDKRIARIKLSTVRETPQLLAGRSTLHKGIAENGDVVLEWIKTAVDKDQLAKFYEQVAKGFAAELERAPVVRNSRQANDDLMTVYPIGDAHIGMLAWGKETQGMDWDLDIAERAQVKAMAALVDMSPPSGHAVIINLGDWFHADNMEGVTTRSKHSLDLDGRFGKMIRVGVSVMRQCIESALAKHKTVRVINVVGNHDDTGSQWLSVALSAAYERNPRVTIDQDPTPFNYVEFGKCLIGTHHGHSCKPDRLPGVMAADQPESWGRTRYRAWYLGHVHHQSVKEYAGVTVESFNTLSAKDAYAAWGGYRAQQNMKAIVHHKEFGEVQRFVFNIDMLK